MIQEQVISKIISTKDSSIITLNNLGVDYFSDYVTEYNFILNHLKQFGNIPDPETFLDKFPDFDYLDVKEPTNYLLEELVKDKRDRIIINSFNKARELYLNGKTDAILSVLKEASEQSESLVSLQATDLIADTSRYDNYLDKIDNQDKYFIKTGFPELDKITGGWDVNEDLVTIVARNGLGKCLQKGTKILMADGSTKAVEDIKIGDKVQSINNINTVLALHNGKSNGFKIIPTLGDPFVVSSNHILTLMKRNNTLRKNNILHTTANTFTLVDMMVEDYLKLTKNQKRQYELYRPEVNYEEKEQKIPAYILGLWLGDGTSCRVSLTNTDQEIINEWCNWGYNYTDTIRKDNLTYDITNPNNKGKKSEVLELFRYYNLINNKHIPLDYLTGSREQRLELLAGIIDTDGYLSKKYREKSNSTICHYSICLKSKVLIENIAQLARGLNYRVGSIKERKINNKVKGLTTYYTIIISGKNIADIPCRLERKKAVNSTTQRSLNLTSFKIEPVEEVEYYGFMADGDHRYLLADNIVTHNTWILLKSAASAAEQGKRVGIYSGEMSEDSVGYRIDTLIGNISNGALVHGSGSVKNQYKNFLSTLSDRVKGSLFVITPKQINGPATVSALRAFIEKYNLDILFVDQHSLLEDERGAKTPVEKASNVSKDLKLLQTTKRIPIIAVSQQNREKLEEGKTFDTTQVAQADRIAQDSSQVIFIERKDDLLKLHLVKSRQSGAGEVLTYKVDLNVGSFVFIPDEKSEEPITDSNGITYDESDVF